MSKPFRQILLWLVLAFGIPLTAPVVWAQTGSLEGDVKGFDGNPLVGALVKIDRKDIRQHFEVKTDKKGHYFHAGLPVSLYRVSVHQDGKELYFLDNIKVPLGDTGRADFDLKKEMERAQSQPRELTKEEQEARAKAEAEMKKHDTMKAHFEKGRELFMAKQFDQAIESFRRAGELDPKQHVIFANLAEAYKNVRNYDEAISNYQRALDVLGQAEKPDAATQASYHMNAGIIMGMAGRLEEASAEIKKSAELNPPNASQAYYNLGATLVNNNKPAEAVEAFKKAVEANPGNADAQYQLGISLVGMAQVTPDGKTIPAPGTVEAFQKYLEVAPTGRFAEQAKGMIEALTQTVETKFQAEKSGKKK
ncbi:MAG: tetratricopeptide repeat protein [Acidobacteriota bacterium]